MTAQETTLKEDLLPLRAVHHVELFAGNAKQSSYYYRMAFGLPACVRISTGTDEENARCVEALRAVISEGVLNER